MLRENKIKVLVVEDSSVVRTLLEHILKSDPQIQVIGMVRNGHDALSFLTRETPNVVLMDIEMPEMDGFETTRRIMETQPLPIVICSGSRNQSETITTFRLMEVGAVAFVEKPVGREHQDFDAVAGHLLQTVKLMSEVKVVRRWAKSTRTAVDSTPTSPATPRRASGKIDVIGIGASTGGPPVIQTILTGLTKDFPVPLLVVQHIAPGFLPGLVDWLNQTTSLNVQVASYGVEPLPGNVYFAPDDYHMAISSGGRIVLSREEPDSGLRPSVAHLFHSLAEFCGSRAVGVLLTGMGKDGAEELKNLKNGGALTIVQDRETSAVHGMPGEAIALGAATYVLPPDGIARALVAAANQELLLKRGMS